MGVYGRLSTGATCAAALAVALLGMLLACSTAFAAKVVNANGSPASSSSGSLPVVKSAEVTNPAFAERFWTPERMLEAESVAPDHPESAFDLPPLSTASTSAATGDFTPGDVTSFPQVVHGRVFFTIGSEAYSCSGTLVQSRNRNVVFTAGHCVFDLTSRTFVQNLVFVPGYESGGTPFGIVPATNIYTTSQWFTGGNFSYDLGVFLLDQPLEDTIGARKIAFDLNPSVRSKNNKYTPREYTIYGYPVKPDPPFNGEILQGCRVGFTGRDNGSGNQPPYPISGSPCSMRQGSSGGGWVASGSYLSSITSYGYCDVDPAACGYVFGPYFSNAAKALYVKAGGSKRPTVRLINAPRKVVRKRKVNFRFGGTFSTLPGFVCKLDRQKEVGCTAKISIARLSPGKHTLRVRAVDQTGRRSARQIVRHFRVKLRRR